MTLIIENASLIQAHLKFFIIEGFSIFQNPRVWFMDFFNLIQFGLYFYAIHKRNHNHIRSYRFLKDEKYLMYGMKMKLST